MMQLSTTLDNISTLAGHHLENDETDSPYLLSEVVSVGLKVGYFKPVGEHFAIELVYLKLAGKGFAL